ncbi:hypothetical protein [Pluralibacter sp.]|uniref:hypothetical protein n=1 Tax=Pluralibacter sp. TaxID=1920032 RepID=UPI0025CE2ECC|nr:hypothetical protein [Pluralibacter sp.]MBV8043206.1 hypothetical protein [Pluralibacter sp.]
MAMTPTLDPALFTAPFTHTTDFTRLADTCECFAEALVECDDPPLKMALCGRLFACLALLQPTLLDPVPAHLVDSLTVTELPASMPVFEPEADQMAEWCQALTHLLMSGSLAPEQERAFGSLLYDLVRYFSETLNAPRWLRTPQGIVSLEDFH